MVPENSCVSWDTIPIWLAQLIEINFVDGLPVISDVAGLGPIEPDQQLHQRRLPRSGRTDKSDRLPHVRCKRNSIQRIRRRGLMLERQIVEFDEVQRAQRQRIGRPRLDRRIENFLQILQRHFGFAIRVDDIADFLQRTEDEERINPHLEELAELNLLR